MKLAAVSLSAFVCLTGAAGCGEDGESAKPRPQTTATPQGEIRSGAVPEPGHPRMADAPALERFIRRSSNRDYAAGGVDARVVRVECLPEDGHLRLCLTVESDGRNDVMIAWGNAAHDRLVVFQSVYTLTCDLVDQGRAGWYAEALAHLGHPRLHDLRPRPTLTQLRRAARRETRAVCRDRPGDRELENEPLVRVEKRLTSG